MMVEVVKQPARWIGREDMPASPNDMLSGSATCPPCTGQRRISTLTAVAHVWNPAHRALIKGRGQLVDRRAQGSRAHPFRAQDKVQGNRHSGHHPYDWAFRH